MLTAYVVNSTNITTHGENVRALRLESSMPQRAYAKLIGLSKKRLGELEHGEQSIQIGTLKTWAEAIGMEPAKLRERLQFKQAAPATPFRKQAAKPPHQSPGPRS